MIGVFKITKYFYFWPSSQQTQSTKDETAGWQTYRNEEYGFEVKYPQNYSYWEAPYSKDRKEVIDIGFRPEDIQGSVFIVTILKDIPLDKLSGYEHSLYGEPTDEKIEVDGAMGVKFSGYLLRMIGVEKDGYTYFLKCSGIKEGDELVFDQMLSTFRFLE